MSTPTYIAGGTSTTIQPGVQYTLQNPAAQSATPTAPTVSSVYGGDYSGANINAAEKASSDFSQGGLSDAEQQSIRDQTTASFQAEIDAQNKLYADKLASAQVQGANRLGSTTAIEARRGVLGSDFGAAQTDTTNNANQDIYNSINDEKAAAIAGIMGNARDASNTAIQQKTQAKQAGLDSYLKYLQDASTRSTTNAQTAAQSLLANKQALTDLTPDQQNQLLTSYGVTPDAVTTAYNTLKTQQDAAAAKAAQDAQYNLTPGTTRYDANGKVIASVPAKQNTQIVSANGRQLLVDSDTGQTIKDLGSSKTATESQAASQKTDVQNAVNQLQTIVKTKNFKGVDPSDYQTLANYLQNQYGTDGVAALKTAMSALDLKIDTGLNTDGTQEEY